MLAVSSTAFAQTTEENFAYGTVTGTSADTLLNPAFGGSVWRRHSGTTGPVVYKAASLTYTGYASSNIGGSVGFTFATGFAQDVNRSTIPVNSGSFYVSFLLNMSSGGGLGSSDSYFFHFMDTTTANNTQFRARHFIKDGSVPNTFKIGIAKSATSTPVYSTLDYPINTPILVVTKYSFYPGATNDSVFSYIFTSGVPSTEPSSATLIATDVTAADLIAMNAIAIRQHPTGSTMSGTIDGIRVSTTWANAPLPVKLTAFDAKVIAKSTLLSWSTSSEMNNNGFEIEISTDGVDFENIGFVKGAGNSNATRYYTFNHDNAEDAFYRLKQIDFDGKTTYSPVISVQNTKAEADLNPNPFNEFIQVTTNNTISHAEIVDMMGKVVLSETVNSNSVNLNAKDLLNGIYFIKIYQGDSVITKRIIKAN